MSDRIEKRIEIEAPVARVWRALTDFREFGKWFQVELDGPFQAGKVSRGVMNCADHGHLKWEATIKEMQHERLFSFTWHPYAVSPDSDYSKEPTTLVEFRLEKSPKGTLLIVSESGFDALPSDRRIESFRMNDSGWAQQLQNIGQYIGQTP
jgi:uncharacterized protein YndB with AHSA1/START domain